MNFHDYKDHLSKNAKETLKKDILSKIENIENESNNIQNIFISELEKNLNTDISFKESLSFEDFISL